MIQKEVFCQQEKVKLALVGRGEYRLLEKYKKDFFISEKLYYERVDMRLKTLNSFNSFIPVVPPFKEQSAVHVSEQSNKNINLDPIPGIPESRRSEIENGATRLAAEEKIMKSNDEVYYVFNEHDLNNPYKVKFTEKDCKFSCETNIKCGRFKTFGICSHVVIVAVKLNILKSFITRLTSRRKKMKNPIITMCNAGKDQTAGQKPRGTKRKGNSNSKAPKILTHVEPKSLRTLLIILFHR